MRQVESGRPGETVAYSAASVRQQLHLPRSCALVGAEVGTAVQSLLGSGTRAKKSRFAQTPGGRKQSVVGYRVQEIQIGPAA